MRYLPWDTEGALWCDWLSIEFQTQTVEFLLAEARRTSPTLRSLPQTTSP
jgi:hypothetical protein